MSDAERVVIRVGTEEGCTGIACAGCTGPGPIIIEVLCKADCKVHGCKRVSGRFRDGCRCKPAIK
jgi:hypothetical protein